MAAAAAAAAVVREAAASAVMDVLDAGESEEEKSSKLAAAKEDKMRKVIRCSITDRCPVTCCCVSVLDSLCLQQLAMKLCCGS